MSTSPEKYKQILTSAGHTYNYYSSASPSSNTTLLFIHGFPYTSKIWRHQVSHFEKLGYSCIVPDILAHGKTSKPTNPAEYAMPVSAKSMVDILDEEGVDRAVVVGHDWYVFIKILLCFYERGEERDEMKTDEPGWEQGKCHRLPHSTHLPLSNPSSGSSLRSVLQTSPIRLQSPQ